MNTCTTHTRNWTLVAELAENPSPAPHSATPRPPDPTAPSGKKPKPQDDPKWKNMTLDEMKTWLEEARRLDREQNETSASR